MPNLSVGEPIKSIAGIKSGLVPTTIRSGAWVVVGGNQPTQTTGDQKRLLLAHVGVGRRRFSSISAGFMSGKITNLIELNYLSYSREKQN